MLIVTKGTAVNMDQVFYLTVNVPVIQLLHVEDAEAYALTAYHSGLADRDGKNDSVILKFYRTEQEAQDELRRILIAYEDGMSEYNLDSDLEF